ncbi:unnamed protein product [Linum trigynum]|uniref:Uncharacterized protein n=1 Tax=Linum trigynum TaxID=586398 RepID=A0AAV2F6I4_9ROSI
MAIADVALSPDMVEGRRLAMEVLFGESPISGGEEEDMAMQSDDDQVYKVVPDDKSTWKHLRFENREAFVKFYKDFAHWRSFGVRRIGQQTRKPKYLKGTEGVLLWSTVQQRRVQNREHAGSKECR